MHGERRDRLPLAQIEANFKSFGEIKVAKLHGGVKNRQAEIDAMNKAIELLEGPAL